MTGVQSASFNIDQSEFLCIVGPSGSGKSTLLGALAGLHRPSAGTVAVSGRDPQRLDPAEVWVQGVD